MTLLIDDNFNFNFENYDFSNEQNIYASPTNPKNHNKDDSSFPHPSTFETTLPEHDIMPISSFTSVSMGSDSTTNATLTSLYLTKSMQEDFNNYTYYILWLKLHGMMTAFFMLWSLATTSLPHEIIATKFLHVLAPFLAIHWWHLSNYPIHLFLLLYSEKLNAVAVTNTETTIGTDNDRGIAEFTKRMKLRIHKGTLFGMLLYVVLFLIDLLYFCIRLAPLAHECMSNDDAVSGRSLPAECSGGGKQDSSDYNYSTSQNKTLFAISFVMTLIHIFFDIALIFVTFSTRNKTHKQKFV